MSNEVYNTEMQVVTPDSLSLITKAEIDMQISTAKAFPRSLTNFMDKAKSMVTLSEDIAESCIYSLPRGGKSLEGASVRLAEIVTATYGNIRSGARVIANDGKTITAQGICHDLETNNSVTVEVKKSILQHEWKNGVKTGRMITMNEDMQVVTGNAACAIAYRNAVLKVVPAALVQPIYEEAKKLLKGTETTLPEKRQKALDYFREKGVKDEQICKVLMVKRVEDIDLEKLFTLRTMATALRNNETTVADLFSDADKKSVVTEQEKELQRLSTHLKNVSTEEALNDLEGSIPNISAEQKALIDAKRKEIVKATKTK